MAQAGYRKRDGLSALERGESAYSVRLFQEALELSLKGLLIGIGADYPKRHNLPSFLKSITHLLPKDIQENLAKITKTISLLAKMRTISTYGSEAELKVPDRLVDIQTARTIIEDGLLIFEIIEREIAVLAEKSYDSEK